METAGRKERRTDRLRRASKLPPGKTFEALDKARVPRTALLKMMNLSRGGFVEEANSVLLFGLPGVGKSHLACALGHALVDAGRSVLFTPTYQLVQQQLVFPRRCGPEGVARGLHAAVTRARHRVRHEAAQPPIGRRRQRSRVHRQRWQSVARAGWQQIARWAPSGDPLPTSGAIAGHREPAR